MRTKNPGLMTQIQDFVNDFFFREYRMPSVQEIATATGIAKSSAHRYLVEMDKRGILSYRAGEILTDMVNGLSFAIKNTPLTGGITCGIPVEENPRVEEYIPLPQLPPYTAQPHGTAAARYKMDSVNGDLFLHRCMTACLMHKIQRLDDVRRRTDRDEFTDVFVHGRTPYFFAVCSRC